MRCNKFSAGLLIGAALGVLFAPDKGCRTRGKIKDACNDIKDQVDRLFGLKQNEIEELYAKLENKAEDITDDMRSKLILLLDNAKSKLK